MTRGIGAGTVSLERKGQLHARVYRRTLNHYPECKLEPRRYDDPKVSEVERFLTSTAERCQRPASIHHIVLTMRVVEAMDCSCETGLWETIGEPARAPEPSARTGESRIGGGV